MKSFKFGNLAVLTLSVLVLLVMISYTLGAATRPSSSLTREEERELRQRQREADYEGDDIDFDVSNEGGGSKRKRGKRRGGKRKGGKRNGGGKRRRDGLDTQNELDKVATNYTMDCECGKVISERIIGGEAAGRNTYPWHAALIGEEEEFLCGGTLINNMYILTAASCVTEITDVSELTVRLREYNLNKPDQYLELNKAVEEIIIHKGYEDHANQDDIALIKLDSVVKFPGTPFLAPVCLPSTKDELYEGEKAIATGWGFISEEGPLAHVLQEVTLKVETNEDCQAAGFPKREIKKTMICAGKKKKKGICNGDMGGPLIYMTEDGRYEQIGISSFTLAGCGQIEHEPSVFTRVNKYLRWIQRKTKDAAYCSGSTFPGDEPPHEHPEEPPHEHPEVPPHEHPEVPPHEHPEVPPHEQPEVPPHEHPEVPPQEHPHKPIH